MNKKECDKIIKTAEKLQKNANEGDARFLKPALTELIFELNWMGYASIDNEDFCKVIQYIADDGYDVSDFQYYEHPMPNIYCFCNSDITKQFDIIIDKQGNVFPAYIDADHNQPKAETIAEAVEKFQPLD